MPTEIQIEQLDAPISMRGLGAGIFVLLAIFAVACVATGRWRRWGRDAS